jgi:hypothetical protein
MAVMVGQLSPLSLEHPARIAAIAPAKITGENLKIIGTNQRELCEPSQSGWVCEFLHPQNHTVLLSSGLNSTGAKGPPLWEPSQKGWRTDSPQAHHQ